MAGPVTITCPRCHTVLPVPTELLGTDPEDPTVVLARMDRTEAMGHQCPGKPAEQPGKAVEKWKPATTVPEADLRGRVALMLEHRAYIVKGGSRACTMCGTTGEACLDQLGKPGAQAACCPSCGSGNTHPAPQTDSTCAEWGAEHGARQ